MTIERMQTQRSARMHRVRCKTMQQSACMPIECKDARCTQIERSRQCNEYDASEDTEYLILNEQSRQAKNKASESSQHPKSANTAHHTHRSSQRSWLYSMYHYAASATQLTFTFEFSFSSVQRPE